MSEDALLANISNKIQSILKNRILILSLFAFAVALCCIFAFAGNESDSTVDNAGAVIQNSDDVVTEADAVRTGYGIYVDGYFVAAAETYEQATQVIDSSLDVRVNSLGIDKNAKNSGGKRRKWVWILRLFS